ncbi:MAG: hydroxyglutarate oxidase [Parachlamydiales bacterium]|nr:hydroxyglutarate oxidase [Parachlamydiales bacterium]
MQNNVSNSMKQCDCFVIGAGLVGLATAYQLLKERPHLKLIVGEKEIKPAQHQSGRNSGVVHSGIYYKPGSQKAKNCMQGRADLLKYCQESRLPILPIHKVIVAQTPREEAYLEELQQRAKANGVPGVQVVGPDRLKEIEPHVRAAQALYLPQCQVVDYQAVAESLCNTIEKMGGEVIFGEKILDLQKNTVIGSRNCYQPRVTINCAGLFSDRLAKIFMGSIEHRICPFRGEYYLLSENKRSLVKGMIYPVPDPRFPFLGVHLTPMVNGRVEAGPNAVLALAREGYRRSDFKFGDMGELLAFPGFWIMAARYWKAGMYEMARSFSKTLFVKDVQRLVPDIEDRDLVRGGAGIRAQVIKRDGSLMDDFAILEDQRSIHVINAPSPAATACFSIGRTIAGKAMARLA